MKAVWVAALCLLPLCAMAEPVEVTDSTALLNRGAQPTENLPCPKGWRVEANPSVENSLSYLHEGGDLAVNISYVADTSGQNVLPEAYARVAAEQMNCQMPVASNLISKAWSFYCDNEDIEAIVYGSEGNLVLLAISGRTPATEPHLMDFVRFLASEANRR